MILITTISLLKIIVPTTIGQQFFNQANNLNPDGENYTVRQGMNKPLLLQDQPYNRSLNDTTLLENITHELCRRIVSGQENNALSYPVKNIRESKLLNTKLKNSEEVKFDPKARPDGYDVTKPEDSPYSVTLKGYASESAEIYMACTGSLLTAEWILTAAHCGNVLGRDVLIIYIIAGTNTILNSTEFYKHPRYIENRLDDDIMVIKTVEKFNLTKFVNTIGLSNQRWPYRDYKQCVMVGFGRVYQNKTHPDDYERKTHHLGMKKPCACEWILNIIYGELAVKKYICSEQKEDYGVCPGDSGGGVVCDKQIRAVAMSLFHLDPYSFCLPIKNAECGSKNTINVFLDICPYVRWINSHVKLYPESDIVNADTCYNWETVEERHSSKGSMNQVLSTLAFDLSSTILIWFKY